MVLASLDLLVPQGYLGFLEDLGPLCLLLFQAQQDLEAQVDQGSLN